MQWNGISLIKSRDHLEPLGFTLFMHRNFFHCSSCLHRHRNSQHFGPVLSFARPSRLPFTYIYIKFMLGILDYGYSSLVLRYSCIHITILIVIYQFILVWLFGHLERSPGFFSGPCEARVGHIYFLAPPASFFQLGSQGFNNLILAFLLSSSSRLREVIIP